VSVIYQYGFFVLIGIVAGIFICIKWIAPPEGDIYFGKLKIRGRGNTVSDIMDVEPEKKRRRKRRE